MATYYILNADGTHNATVNCPAGDEHMPIPPDGGSVTTTPPPPAGPTWSDIQTQARTALDTSDTVVIRCAEHGVAVPDDWKTYRAALRAIISTSAGDPATPLPDRPGYPAGT
jgi:hypothetical protein